MEVGKLFFGGRGQEKRPKKEAPRTNKEKIPLQQVVLLSEQKHKGPQQWQVLGGVVIQQLPPTTL